MELLHLDALAQSGKKIDDLPNEIQNGIEQLDSLIEENKTAPSDALTAKIELASANIAHAILDFSEIDLPDEPEVNQEASTTDADTNSNQPQQQKPEQVATPPIIYQDRNTANQNPPVATTEQQPIINKGQAIEVDKSPDQTQALTNTTDTASNSNQKETPPPPPPKSFLKRVMRFGRK